jgi:ribosomal protein S18 acetylase RimI-like enzyme
MAGRSLVLAYEPARHEAWATAFLEAELGGRLQARRDELVDVLGPGLGFVAERDDRPAGILAYRIEPDAVELAALAVTPRHAGLGSALVAALAEVARAAGRRRIWVVTTNDNVDALRFYQRRGYRIVAVRVGAVDRARDRLKPSIGRLGQHGIPLRDEIELVLELDGP